MRDMAIVISDLHLDAYTAGVPRRADVRACLDEVSAYWVATDPDPDMRPMIFFAGDLCDPGERSHAALRDFSHWISTIPKVSMFAINGNHDVVEDGSGASTLSVLSPMFDDPMLLGYNSQLTLIGDDLREHALHVLPFEARSHSYNPEVAVEDWSLDTNVDVVIGHLNLEGMIHGSETDDMPRGREVFWPIDKLKELFPDAILMGGHYHAPQDKDGIHIIGAPGDFSFGDEHRKLPHSFSVIYENDQQKVAVKRVPFKSARQVATVRKLPANIAELGLLPNAIVRLDLQGTPQSAVSDLEHELASRVDRVIVKGSPLREWVPVTDPEEIKRRWEVSAAEAAKQAASEIHEIDANFRKDVAHIVELLGGEAASQ